MLSNFQQLNKRLIEDRMIAEGLGDLDKSGIAELTFKDRRKRSGDGV